MELQIDTQSLDRVNKGTNFLNLSNDYDKKKYFIEVLLLVEHNLNERKEEVSVRTNLPIESDYWKRDVKSFFENLKQFVIRPIGKIILPNKSELNTYGLRGIEEQIREKSICFEDIDLTIGELARKKLDERGIDFEKEVKKLLGEQTSESKQDKITAYVRLKDKIQNLKGLLCRGTERYGYGYREVKDDTMKMPLTAEEYNSKLKEVEKELRKLEKEFGLSKEDLDYIEIKEAQTFEKWLKENEEELKENFEQEQEDSAEKMTFDEYAEMCYEMNEEE